MYHSRLDGRWLPDEDREWPLGDEWNRVRLNCCPGSDRAYRIAKLDEAATRALRGLYDTRQTLLQITPDMLLSWAQ